MVTKYRIEVRHVFGDGHWGGSKLGVEWTPAISGTLNQTGRSDVDASTFDSREFADAIVSTVVELHMPRWRLGASKDGAYEGYDVRVVAVADTDTPWAQRLELDGPISE